MQGKWILVAATTALLLAGCAVASKALRSDAPPQSDTDSEPVNKFSELEGAWEPGYVGPRVEIEGDRFIRLWNGGVVLDTTFTAERDGDAILLHLQDTALRHTPNGEPYATMKSCRWENGALTLTDDFPITGESIDTLLPTTKSRYGDVTILDDVLPLLAGDWEDELGMTISFEGDRMLCRGRAAEVIAVRYNWDSSERIFLIDRDPAKHGLFGFSEVRVFGDRLFATVPIMDAPAPAELVFTKKDK